MASAEATSREGRVTGSGWDGVLEDRIQPAAVLGMVCVDPFFGVEMCGTCQVLLSPLLRSNYKMNFFLSLAPEDV